jgi:hypothetical protein
VIKLGKLPVDKERVKKLVKFSDVLVSANLPPLPPSFDLDAVLNVTDTRMFLNDTYGDCVEAGSCHAINRYEQYQCQCTPNIPDADVATQYFKETGGQDTGLNILDHLTTWQTTGLTFGGRTYTIDSFAAINWLDHTELMYAVYLLDGIYLGMQVPTYFMDGFESGQRYFDLQFKNTTIEGGHCIYGMAYLPVPPTKRKCIFKVVSTNATGPIIETWAARVQLSWPFVDTFFDEAYGIIQSFDKWANPATDPLNIPLLKSYVPAIERV